MTTIIDEQLEAAAEAMWNRQRDAIKGRDGINGRLTWRSMQVPETFWSGYILDARAALTAAAQAGPTVDTTKLNFSQVVNRIMRVIDHNDAGSGGSRMDFAKAIAKGVFDLSEAMAVQAGKSSNILTHAVQYRRKDQIENFDPWHTMAAFDCESAASAYCRKQSSVSWEYRWICLEPDRVEPPLPAADTPTATPGRADDWQWRIKAAVETGNNSYWSDAEKQRAAFIEWSSGGHKGDCPQISSGSIVDYITRSVCFMLAASPSPPAQSVEGDDYDRRGAISIQDPVLLVESLIQFGRSPDGSVERDLRHAISTLTNELAEAKKVIEHYRDTANPREANTWLDRNKS